MGAEGRPPLPVALKVLNGRGINMQGEPLDSGGRPIPAAPSFKRTIPEPPDTLDKEGRAIWRRIVPELFRVDVAREIDLDALHHVCQVHSMWHEAMLEVHRSGISEDMLNGGTRQTAAVRTMLQATAEVRRWFTEYGLTPAAEVKVSGAKYKLDKAKDSDNP